MSKIIKKKQKGGTIGDAIRTTGQVLETIGRNQRRHNDKVRGAQIAAVVIGGVIFLGIKGAEKGIELSKDGYESLKNYFNSQNKTNEEQIKRIEDFTLEEIYEIEQFKDQLSLTNFAKVESRKRKLLNQLSKNKDSILNKIKN